MPLTVKNSRGFTLIELLVVISIMGLLTSVVFASLTSARDRGRLGAAQYFSSSLNHGYAADATAMYDFEEGSGNAIDSANSYNLTPSGTGAGHDPETPNKSAWSASLDGASIYASTANVPITSDWTFSTWVKPTAAPTNTTGIFLSLASPFYLRYAVAGFAVSWGSNYPSSPCSGTQCTLYGGGAKASGVWYNVAASHSGTLTTLYVDGKEAIRFSGANSTTPSGKLYIGALFGNSYYYTGLVDDVRIYTQSLLGADIQKIYAEGRAAHPLALNK